MVQLHVLLELRKAQISIHDSLRFVYIGYGTELISSGLLLGALVNNASQKMLSTL